MEGPHADHAGCAFGEFEHLQRFGKGDQPLDVVGDDLLETDREIDREVRAVEQFRVVDEFTRAQACDAGRQVEQGAGDLARTQVGLVGLGDGNQQVGVVCTGIAQHGRRGTVAAHRTHLESLAQDVEQIGVGIDQRDVVGFGNEVFGNRNPDLAGAQNDDLHLRYALTAKACIVRVRNRALCAAAIRIAIRSRRPCAPAADRAV